MSGPQRALPQPAFDPRGQEAIESTAQQRGQPVERNQAACRQACEG